MLSQQTLRTINAAATLSTALAGSAPAARLEVITTPDVIAHVPEIQKLKRLLNVDSTVWQLVSSDSTTPQVRRWASLGATFDDRYHETHGELGGESRQYACYRFTAGPTAVLVATTRPGQWLLFSGDGGRTFFWVDHVPTPPTTENIDGRPWYEIEREKRNKIVDARPATGELSGYAALCEHFVGSGEMKFSEWSWYGGKKLPISKDPATQIRGTWDSILGATGRGGYRRSSWGADTTWYLVEGTGHYIKEGWFRWL
ncbi:hypothetical protein [Nocardia thailandica]|uniref:hypothetical protein n=1 Tax=Nocardia thailandica TaxID=257275 RepID=UPI0002D44DB4|nr:hypothetical protein [Nocardia thailandica]